LSAISILPAPFADDALIFFILVSISFVQDGHLDFQASPPPSPTRISYFPKKLIEPFLSPHPTLFPSPVPLTVWIHRTLFGKLDSYTMLLQLTAPFHSLSRTFQFILLDSADHPNVSSRPVLGESPSPQS